MWRLNAAAVLIAALSSCSRPTPPLPQASADLQSEVDVADPKALVQLVHGFWKVEGGGWRWTTDQFSVVLKSPTLPAASAVLLRFQFDLPPVIAEQLGTITVQAKVNGLKLDPETFSGVGPKAYVRPVPREALSGDADVIEFSTDKELTRPGGDNRDLAVIARHFSLSAQ